MFGKGKGARKFNQIVTLTKSQVSTDDFGHTVWADPVTVANIWASVERMTASKTLATFQLADVIGLDIQFHNPVGLDYNGLTYQGHDVHFATPEDVDGRGRVVRIIGYYQQDGE